MKIFVGLGNPGPRYARTRHNVGFRVVECLADRLHTSFSREKYHGLIAEAVLGDEKVLLVKPLTFMNHSGDCVARVLQYNPADLTDLLVVVDDVNLPLGKLRLRGSGSAGGHNGLKSIIERLGDDGFPRLRVGIGQEGPGTDLTGHVLGRFAPDEWPILEATVPRVADAALRYHEAGLEKAMTEFNR